MFVLELNLRKKRFAKGNVVQKSAAKLQYIFETGKFFQKKQSIYSFLILLL